MLLLLLIIIQPKLRDNSIYLEHEGFHIIQTLKFISCFTGPFLQQIHQIYYIIELFTFPNKIGSVYKPSYCYSHTVLKQQHNTLFNT